MKKLLLATVALVALGATVPALAADLGTRPRPYTKAPAYMAPIYNWTGFYIGGHIGGAFGGNHGFAGTTNSGNSGSFLGGVQAGADYQFASSWVAGVEAQYSWLGSNTNSVAFGGTGFVYNNNQRALGSFTGRVGYTWGPGLLYVKGGYAYSDFNQSLTSAACRRRSRSTAATMMATPSVPASNTCSRRVGPPRSNISTTTSARPPS